jgi:simple sugar transport system ATP-binding protein
MFLPFELMSRLADSIIGRYDVQTSSSHALMRSLSGGNQQKVLIGREFAKNPQLIIASQPTRGVDIGVMEKVHKELINSRNEGTGILLVSSDLDEVLKLSDYIIVMYEGKIVGQGPIDKMPLSKISQLMTTGVSEEVEKK